MPGSTFCSDDDPVMAAQPLAHRSQLPPPPVAPRTSRPPAPPTSEYVHARSGSMDSLESSSSGGSSCSVGRQETVPEYVPARAPYKAPKAPSNALQFVKVQSPLYKKAEQQIKLTKEVKITREALKEGEEEWQSNLDNWKSRRRKVSEKVIQRAEEMRQIEVEEQVRQDQILQQQRKIKKFSEIVEKRSTKRTYNFDLYVGQGDDSGLGGTPEPEDQDMASDSLSSVLRSDTSEGMTSEAESVDSDIHRSDKISEKEPPKVHRKPHPWSSQRSITLQADDHSTPDDLLCNLSKDLGDNLSSAEPSDIEGHAGDTETVSSEEDISYSCQVGNVDSGHESLSDCNRPSDIADSASDFSQDSSTGLDKNSHDIFPDFCIGHQLEDSSEKKEDILNNIDIKDSESMKINYKIAVKPGDNRGFGFTLKGGKDQGCTAHVDTVMKGGASDISGLVIGDQILMINGELTSDHSHASLVFSVKQAVYAGLLDIVVWRSSKQEVSFKKESPKPIKKGSSFAEKLALFSNGVTPPTLPKSPSPGSTQKGSKLDESRTESLVLRRRSTFENGIENSDFRNLRSHVVTQNSSSTTNGDNKHSADLSSVHLPSENGVGKKGKPPPPVPAKPKLKFKPNQSEETPFSISRSDRMKLIKQKTFDLELGDDSIVKTPLPLLETSKHEEDKLLPPPSSFVSDSFCVINRNSDEALRLEEDKIINSLGSVLSSEPTTIVEDVDYSSKLLDSPNSEFVPSAEEELSSQQFTFEEPCNNELVTLSGSEPNTTSINSKLYHSHANAYESYCKEDNYKCDNIPNFESEEAVPSYQGNYSESNYSDFRENEHIQSCHDGVDNKIETANTLDAYNIICEGEAPISPNNLQSSLNSNSYSDIDSNTISTEHLAVSTDDSAISSHGLAISTDDLESSTTDDSTNGAHDLAIAQEYIGGRTDEMMTQAVSDDVDNDACLSSPISACEEPYENESVEDLEVLYGSELAELQNLIRINSSPLCLPLEKIDEDDVISASTATSSDSPNTETVIETMPSNISPLPNDEPNGEIYLSNAQEPTNLDDIGSPLKASKVDEKPSSCQESSSIAISRDEEYNYSYEDSYKGQKQEDSEFEESLDQITSLDVIDEMEQRLMQQLEQQGDASFEDVPGDLEAQLGEVVDRQWLYLTEEASLLDDLCPKNLEPPREPPPPPPPPDVETLDKNVHPFARANSTKRIKKELWRRRSDFLGLDSPEGGIDVDNIPPPPPGLEEILKQEREQNQWLEKRLSLAEADYSLPIDTMESVSLSSANTYSEYTCDYFLEDNELSCEAQNEDYIDNLDEQLSFDDPSFNQSYEDAGEIQTNTIEISKPLESPQHKAKQHIQSLGAAPKAKIMDSNKWITEKKFAAMKQKAVLDPVFSHGNYNQNYWLAQEGGGQWRLQAPVDRRFSMPPAYSTATTHPDVTVRTWGDRECELQQQRPRSEFWDVKTSADRCGQYQKQDLSRTRSLDSRGEVYEGGDTLESEVHNCSCCGKGLCEGSAMGIEALQLYFHIECFRCCLCHIPLGNGSCGTDVQVKNNQLYCPVCFTVD